MVAKKKTARKTSKRTTRKPAKRTVRESSVRRAPVRSSSRKSSRHVAPVGSVRRAQRSQSRRYRPSTVVAVIALLVNILLFPGLGTVIGGRTREGIWQIILFGVGAILSIIIIGIPLIIAAWVWALISGIRILKNDVRD